MPLGRRVAHKTGTMRFIRFATTTGERGGNIKQNIAYLSQFFGADINPDTNFSRNREKVLTLTQEY